MRELTKSLTSYTWAMSVFWTQQMFNFFGLSGSGAWDRSTRSFNNVTEATTNEMGDTMRAVFRGGDTLQRGMVDLFMAPFSAGNWGGNGSSTGSGNGHGTGAGSVNANTYGNASTSGNASGTRNGYGAAGGRGNNNNNSSGGWADTAARVVQAGADVTRMTADVTRATADAAARATRPTTQQAPQQRQQPQNPSGAPPSSDPSLGWGPMPR